MPDLSIEKLVLFLFGVTPGFIAMQVYALKCPPAKREWHNSLIEIVTYSLINLAIWHRWVFPLVMTPYEQIDAKELTAAIICVCFISPSLLSLGWYELRTHVLHRKLKMDHPTPRAWDYFVRKQKEYWVLFHLKSGKLLGGYFGGNSYASTFPHEPEICVEEIYRVDANGRFVEIVEDTLGGVIRISECERVEFLKVMPKEKTDERQKGRAEHSGTSAGDPTALGGPGGAEVSGTNGDILPTEQHRSEAPAGGVGHGTANEPVKVS